MNSILTLRGRRFEHRSRPSGARILRLPSGVPANLDHLEKLHKSLLRVKEFWEGKDLINGVLASVYYRRIVSKSNRISGYLAGEGNPSDTVVGARFTRDRTKHIITHFISREILDRTIETSGQVIKLFASSFVAGILSECEFADRRIMDLLPYSDFGLSKSVFRQYLRDSCLVESFGVEMDATKVNGDTVVTFYDVDLDAIGILSRLNIRVPVVKMIGRNSVLLEEKDVAVVLREVPYLVSMAAEDFAALSPEGFSTPESFACGLIPAPSHEPVIGVIDTLFDTRVYFSEWVEYHDMISGNISRSPEDYCHGTGVTSLIVDAPRINPRLDDGCGRFRVRHFGVALQKGFSSFSIIKEIRDIVSRNLDIKVWNLSLGSKDEISDNSISVEGAVLDELQYEYDVIFVVAGTNGTMKGQKRIRIGSPADSINSLVVNSVDFNGNPTSYDRRGEVLSFFIKPDIAYYGGDQNGYIHVCEPLGLQCVTGTSFAAPFVTRKMAYLIHVMGLNRQEAKALLIDSAVSWNREPSYERSVLVGRGVVPVKIRDILTTGDDEIKFIVSDTAEKYDTYNYHFPVPLVDGLYPYVARATMCYFPRCSRCQGVDYTNTELQISLGRLSGARGGIVPVSGDSRHFDDAPAFLSEESARNEFRKWDNVKCVIETFTGRKKAKPVLNQSNPMWGMSIKAVQRLGKMDEHGLRFAAVVTLKEIKGINRIEDFINQANLKGWIVSRLEVKNQIEVYNMLNQEITLE